MNDKRYKILLGMLIMIIISLTAFIYFDHSAKVELENNLIKEKAISICLAIHSGNEDYLKKESLKNVQDYLLEDMRFRSGKALDLLRVSQFSRPDANAAGVQLQVIDSVSEGTIWYGMDFRKINGSWILTGFVIDG